MVSPTAPHHSPVFSLHTQIAFIPSPPPESLVPSPPPESLEQAWKAFLETKKTDPKFLKLWQATGKSIDAIASIMAKFGVPLIKPLFLALLAIALTPGKVEDATVQGRTVKEAQQILSSYDDLLLLREETKEAAIADVINILNGSQSPQEKEKSIRALMDHLLQLDIEKDYEQAEIDIIANHPGGIVEKIRAITIDGVWYGLGKKVTLDQDGKEITQFYRFRLSKEQQGVLPLGGGSNHGKKTIAEGIRAQNDEEAWEEFKEKYVDAPAEIERIIAGTGVTGPQVMKYARERNVPPVEAARRLVDGGLSFSGGGGNEPPYTRNIATAYYPDPSRGGETTKVRIVDWDNYRFAREDFIVPSERKYVSGVHAEIFEESGVWYIRDLGSTYGTWVNGVLVSKLGVPSENPHHLNLYDEIVLGYPDFPGQSYKFIHTTREQLVRLASNRYMSQADYPSLQALREDKAHRIWLGVKDVPDKNSNEYREALDAYRDNLQAQLVRFRSDLKKNGELPEVLSRYNLLSRLKTQNNSVQNQSPPASLPPSERPDPVGVAKQSWEEWSRVPGLREWAQQAILGVSTEEMYVHITNIVDAIHERFPTTGDPNPSVDEQRNRKLAASAVKNFVTSFPAEEVVRDAGLRVALHHAMVESFVKTGEWTALDAYLKRFDTFEAVVEAAQAIAEMQEFAKYGRPEIRYGLSERLARLLAIEPGELSVGRVFPYTTVLNLNGQKDVRGEVDGGYLSLVGAEVKYLRIPESHVIDLQGSKVNGIHLNAIPTGDGYMVNRSESWIGLVNIGGAIVNNITAGPSMRVSGEVVPLIIGELRGDGATLTDANFAGVTVKRKIDLKQLTALGLNMSGAKLPPGGIIHGDMPASDFTNAVVNRIDYSNSNLSESDFSGARVGNSSFYNSNLTGVVLLNADISGAYFIGANLNGATFSDGGRVTVENVNFRDANLSNALLMNVTFKNVNLTGVDFEGAALNGARLVNVEFSTEDQERWKSQGWALKREGGDNNYRFVPFSSGLFR